MSEPVVDWKAVSRQGRSLEVYLLGTVDFDSALALQEQFRFEVAERSDTQGVLLLAEHPPTVTVGREGRSLELADTAEEIRRRGIAVRWVSRGGGVVVHTPGQLAVYPILPLQRLGVGMAEFRRRLERVAVAVAAELKLLAVAQSGLVLVGPRNRAVAFVGAAVRNGVSHHGLFINVGADLYFVRKLLRPELARQVTSLEVERQRPAPMHVVRESAARYIAEQFGYDQTYLYSGHPLLKRTRRSIHAYA